MKKFIIERSMPDAGKLTQADLAEISKVSSAAVMELGKPYHWIESYIVDDKIFCVHIAPDIETVRKHSEIGCFPIDRIYEVKAMMDPSTRV